MSLGRPINIKYSWGDSYLNGAKGCMCSVGVTEQWYQSKEIPRLCKLVKVSKNRKGYSSAIAKNNVYFNIVSLIPIL